VNKDGNDPPDAVNDSVSTDEDTPTIITVLGNDTDPDSDPLTVLRVVGGEGPSHGEVTLKPDGTFYYAPDLNYNGPDSFVYQISDGNGGTDTATGE